MPEGVEGRVVDGFEGDAGLSGGYLKAITPAWQKVRVPFEKFLPKGTFFLRWHTAGLGLSAPDGARPATYHVDLIQVEPYRGRRPAMSARPGKHILHVVAGPRTTTTPGGFPVFPVFPAHGGAHILVAAS